MATYDLKRFARAHILKAIAPKNLVSFLLPYGEYFEQRGFDMSLIREEMKSEDFNVLLRVLINPDLDTPQRLIDALYHVNEMATQEGMEILLAAYEEAGYSFDDPDPTPADLAVQAWMMNGRLFETTCANQYKLKPRPYRVYQSANVGNGSMRSDGEALVAFEHDLNDWFERRKRGRHCKVFPFPSENDCCYIIRHGEPYARVSTINKGESSCVFFQPEKFDTLIYDFDSGRLRIGASSKPTRGLYRAAFGRHLFGDDDYFPESPLFTLQPLLTDGRESLFCNDIPGLQHITLKHVQVRLDGGDGLRVTYDSEDLFDDARFLRLTPPDALVTEAVLSVKFVGEGRARSTEIRIPNIVECRRDGDGVVLDKWLRERGFISGRGTRPEALGDEETREVVAHS